MYGIHFQQHVANTKHGSTSATHTLSQKQPPDSSKKTAFYLADHLKTHFRNEKISPNHPGYCFH